MIIHNPVITGSLQVNGTSVSSIEQLDSVSGSVAALNNATSSYALKDSISGSFTSLSSSLASELLKNTTDTLTGDLTVTGTLTAQDLHVQEVTSSIVYSSGSNVFGNTANDTQTLYGTVVVGDGSNSGILQFENDVKTRKISLYEIANNDYQFYGFGINTNTLVYHTADTADDHVFFAGASPTTRNELMRIGGDGRVGIGNDTPGADLHIGDVETTPAGTAGTVDRLHIHPYSNTGGPYKFIARTINGSEDYLDMYYGSSVHIISYGLSGNVGIGQTKPTGSLHITDGNNHAYIGDLQGNSTMLLRMSDNAGYPVEVQAHGTQLRFNTATTLGATPSVKMKILPDGNVGIGADNPQAKLHVSGSSNTNIIVDAGPNGSASLRLRNDAHDWDVNCQTNDNFAIYSQTDTTERLVILPTSGNVGIGTNVPTKKLVVRHDENGDPAILKIENRDGNSNAGAFIGFSTGYEGYATIGAKREGAENDSTLVFSPMLNEAAVAKMYLTSAGVLKLNSDTTPALSSNFFISRGDQYGFHIHTQSGFTRLISSDDYLYLGTGADNTTVAINGGEVGIGNTNPQRKLHVVDTNPQIRVSYSSPTDARYAEMAWSGLTVYANDDNNNSANIGMYGGSTSEGKLNFLTGPSTDNQIRMTIGRDGNVGIGDTGPNAKLTVWTPSTTGQQVALRLNNPYGFANTDTGAQIIFSQDRSTSEDLKMGTIGVGQLTGGTSDNAYMTLQTVQGGTMSEGIRISTNGFVGIGTTDPTARLQLKNNVSSNQFDQFSDYQIILYKDGNSAASYGFGIEDFTLMYNSNSYHKFYVTNNPIAFIHDNFSVISNNDAGRHMYENKGGRLLTSNGTGWLGDGRDPILTLATAGDSNNTNIAESIGLNLYTAGTSNGVHSPAIAFSNRSNSGDYESAFGIIIGKKTGQGVDSNWSAGELHFYTGKEAAYMDNNPDLKIDAAGRVTKVRTPYFEAFNSTAITVTSTDTKLTLTQNEDVGSVYDGTTNYRFTAPVAGKYLFTVSSSVSALGGGTYNAIYLVKNGTGTSFRFRAPGNLSSSTWGGIAGSAILSLAANDYVELNAYVQSGTITLQSGETRWCGYLLG